MLKCKAVSCGELPRSEKRWRATMIPSRFTEDEAVDLALFTLAQALRESRGVSPTVDRTHLVKAVFRLAEDIELPITRCWFKFGQFVLSGLATPEHFAHIRDAGIGSLSTKVGASLTEILQTHASGLVPFFSQPLDQYLPDNYQTQAPERYREIYTANFECLSFCRRLVQGPDLRGRRTRYADNARPYVTRLHRAAAPFIADSEARSIVIDYTTLLEELVIRYDVLMAVQDFDLRAWNDFFTRATEGYLEKVWTLPAAQIAAETMVGPRAQEERDRMLHTASLGDRYRREFFEPMRDEAEEKGYLPAEEDLEGLVSAARQRTSRADAIEELSYLTRKGD